MPTLNLLKMINNREILAFLPAGGMGERLRPLTSRAPKPMLFSKITGRDSTRLIDYALEGVASNQSITNVILSTFYKSGQVESYVKEKYPNVQLRRDSGLNGIGGSIVEHINDISQSNAETVLVIPTDYFVTKKVISQIVESHLTNSTDITILGTPTLTSHEVYNIDNEFNYVTSNNQNGGDLVEIGSLGMYVLDKKWLLEKIRSFDPNRFGYCDLTFDIVFDNSNSLTPNIKFYSIIQQDNWADLGTFDDYYQHVMSNSDRDKFGNVVFDNADFSEDAEVRDCILLPGSKIKRGVSVTRSILDMNTSIDPDNQNEVTVSKLGIKIFSNGN